MAQLEKMTYAEYDSLPGIRATDLKTLAKAPAQLHYDRTHERETTPALTFGKLVHACFLEPATVSDDYIALPKLDRRTKEGKALYAEFLAAAEGKEVIAQDVMNEAHELSKSLMRNATAAELLACSQIETTHVWDDVNDMRCKARIDIMGADYCADLKTTADASPKAVSQAIFKFGYHIQAAHYLAGTGKDRFIFIFVEKKAPYLSAVYELGAESIETGRAQRQELLGLYKACEESDNWPGYPVEIETIDLPEYAFFGGYND